MMSPKDQTPLSFERDIRPMFTDMDIEHMEAYDMDLGSRDDVEAHADAIYREVSGGTMPPPGAGESTWSGEMCERFKAWQSQGCPP
jgi:hypothetical protein